MTALDLVRRYADAWNRHDASGIVDCFADGGTYHDPASGRLTGPAIGDYADSLIGAFPDLRFEIVRMDAICDDRVVMEWIMCGTNAGMFAGAPPTGRAVALPGVDIITANGGGITSVHGYFDQRTLVDQLGLQVIVQPHAIGPFTFGRSTRVSSGSTATPNAVSLTWVDVRSPAEAELVIDYSRKIAVDMLQMPGFISWIGIVIGQRLYTLTAWENAEAVERLVRNPTHREAVKVVFGPDFASAAQTGVYAVHHLNPLWLRCDGCNQMVKADPGRATCECGAPMPPMPALV